MKVVVISDVHSSFENLEKILKFARLEGIRHCFVCGDITHFASNDILRFESLIDEHSMECFAVHGNCDPPRAIELLNESDVIFIHGKSYDLGDLTLHGVGGSNYTPFNTPSEYSEEEIRDFTKNFEYGDRNILISHCPPYGILDTTYSGVSAGCTALREIVSNFDLIFCGHIHEARGRESKVTNSGAVLSGNFAVWDLSKNRVKLMNIFKV
jgi:hypothetical protein